MAADGTITVAWHEANPCSGASVWIATAPPGGTFGPAAKVSDNAFYPQLAVAPDGTVTLLYKHDKGSCVNEERAQVRPRTGSPTDTVISDPAYGSVFDASIGIDANGTATVAFVQSLKVAPFTHVLRTARRPAGGAWTGTNLGTTGDGDSALAVAQDGSAVIANARAIAAGYAVEVRSRDVGGISFGAPQTVTDTSDNHTLSGVAISNGGEAAVTTADEQLTVRPPGAVSFGQAAPIGLPVSAANLLPVFTGQGELVLFDAEQPAGASDYSLVARVRQGTAGAALGAPQPTGLTSTTTGAASLAPFGANDVAAGWQNEPSGATEFGAGVALGDGTPPALGQVSAPSDGLAGTPLSFGAAPTDNLGIAGVQWAFGDGATATGATTTHAFAAPGASTWSAAATDLAGNRATATGGADDPGAEPGAGPAVREARRADRQAPPRDARATAREPPRHRLRPGLPRRGGGRAPVPGREGLGGERRRPRGLRLAERDRPARDAAPARAAQPLPARPLPEGRRDAPLDAAAAAPPAARPLRGLGARPKRVGSEEPRRPHDVHAEVSPMSEPLRIGLRLLGLVVFLVGLAMIVVLVYPGPGNVANWMGNSCAHTTNGPTEQCTIFDVLEFIFIAPWLILVGGVLALALRPPGKGPMTIDLSGRE